MSMEECQLCGQDSTPWKKINGHICQDCYACSKRLYVFDLFWTEAKEKMPEKDGRYLVVEDHSYNWVGVSTMRDGKFDMPITHWMELPNAPI